MPTLDFRPASGVGAGHELRLDDLRRAMRAPGWRTRWRPRALDARIAHGVVPGLVAGPGFEMGGDPRGLGWLELRPATAVRRAGDEVALIQELLEVTRRPWGLLALLPAERSAPPRLVEARRDAALGRGIAAAAAERLAAAHGTATCTRAG